ncbi:MAG: PhzF family phenazine biosynthesis protein [Cytophagales bacterium]|nr:PhzF family phenazine biosynthesis protein [Cytophagales bacterium]
MELKLYQIDAFANQIFEGNPAMVCPLKEWISDELMQKMGNEHNLSETVFYVPKKSNEFEIRWFTPTIEVNLCGHATLATAFVEFFIHNNPSSELIFYVN